MRIPNWLISRKMHSH